MKTRNIILFGLVMILLTSFVFAGTSYQISEWKAYYSLDNSALTGTGKFYNELNFSDVRQLTHNAALNISGQVNRARDSDNSAKMEVGDYFDVTVNDTFTICFGLNQQAYTASDRIVDKGSGGILILQNPASGSIAWGSAAGFEQYAVPISSWKHICAVYDGGTGFANLRLALNGAFVDPTGTSGTFSGFSDVSTTLSFLGNSVATQIVDAYIDEIAIFYKNLTATQISDIYGQFNAGLRLELPEVASFEIKVFNYYNSSSINTFNATIINSTDTTTIYTNNGTIYYPIIDELVNITVFNVSGGNTYFNRTYLNWNTSTNLDSKHWQAILYTYALENYTNSSITNFNNTVGTQLNTSSGSFTTHYLNADNYNYTAKAAGDYGFNSTGSVTLSSLEIKNITIGFIPYQLNVTARDIFTNSTITDFTIQIYNETLGILYNVTTTTGLAQVYGVNGTYELTIFNNDYSDAVASVVLNTTSRNYTFYLYTTNSIYFRFYDDVLGNLIDYQTVNIELISDVFADNYSTNNGTFYIDLLSPSAYVIRSSSSGFATNFYEYTLTNNSNTSINIYLLNESTTNYKQITATVYDQNRREVEDAVIKVLRYDIDTNSYVLRQIVRTNFEGQALLEIVKFEEFYKFIIEYNGEQKLETSKTQIFEDSISFQISTGSEIGEDFFNTVNIESSLYYQNNSERFRYYFSDPGNRVTSGCLYVYEKTGITITLLNSSCSDGTSGVLYANFIINNETGYVAYGYIYFGDTEKLIEIEELYFSSTPDFGKDGWMYDFILTVLIAFTAIYSIPLAIALVPFPTVLLSIIGWIDVNPALAFGIWGIAIILSILLKRRVA